MVPFQDVLYMPRKKVVGEFGCKFVAFYQELPDGSDSGSLGSPCIVVFFFFFSPRVSSVKPEKGDIRQQWCTVQV